LKKAEKVKNSDQTSVRATRSQRREARGRPVHSRTRLPFLRKNYAATSIFVNAAFFMPSLGSVFSDYFCATRVDPWYLYEASLKLFGFVLLHKVPKEKTTRRWRRF
jgi:hypothetical protein